MTLLCPLTARRIIPCPVPTCGCGKALALPLDGSQPSTVPMPALLLMVSVGFGRPIVGRA